MEMHRSESRYERHDEDGIEKSSKNSTREKDGKKSSRGEDRDKGHRSKDKDRSKRTGEDITKDLEKNQDEHIDKEHGKDRSRNNKVKDKDHDREKTRDKDRERDKDRKDRGKEKEREREREAEKERGKEKSRDRDREKERDRKKEKEREKYNDRDTERESDMDGDRERGREKIKEREKEADHEKERLKENGRGSKRSHEEDHDRTKDDIAEMRYTNDRDSNGSKRQKVSFGEDEQKVEGTSGGGQTSSSVLEERILKMKEERLKKNLEGDSEVLAWVSRSRKLAEKRNADKEKAKQLSKIFEEQDNIVQGESEDEEEGEYATGMVRSMIASHSKLC